MKRLSTKSKLLTLLTKSTLNKYGHNRCYTRSLKIVSLKDLAYIEMAY
jgi:hypothetical protein